jgi:three-Cys-motif partner protein
MEPTRRLSNIDIEEPQTDPQLALFDVGPPSIVEPEVLVPRYPVWTENKAVLIQRYLYYFVLVTKHGAYIDGFAGPQDASCPQAWAAKLVLESQPRWLRRLILMDNDPEQVNRLETLCGLQIPRATNEPKRVVEVLPAGDFNVLLPVLLSSNRLNPKHATFCLLDQRTFECRWATVEQIARYRPDSYKVEQFYFLANAWLPRALAGTTTDAGRDVVTRWWGRSDWAPLQHMGSWERAELMCKRFREELGYASVKAWPIYERENGGQIMYYMIHATDHPEAPKLMARAYAKAVGDDPAPHEQMAWDFPNPEPTPN